MTALLEVRDLTRTFGALNAVAGVSFSVRTGELVGLIGPNGAGKSTLYNVIAGAIAPTSGEVVFKDRSVAGWKPYQAARAGVARTFQIPKPYRHLSVVENVVLSALLHDRTVAAARESAQMLLAEVGLADYLDAPVGTLTVGLLKRLEVARALALRPSLVPVRRDHGGADAERGEGHDASRRRPAGARHHRDLGRARALRHHAGGATHHGASPWRTHRRRRTRNARQGSRRHQGLSRRGAEPC
jgi:ABC-type uncharacterized transport system ATPase subunit